MINVDSGQPSAYFPLRITKTSSQEPQSVVPIQFPSTRSVLWESKAVGDFEPLTLTLAKQHVQLFIVEKSLRLAHRYSAGKPATSFLLGSIYPKSAEGGICFGVDRFDPGREVSEQIGENVSKCKVPTAVVPGDHIIPIKTRNELLASSDSISHTKDEFARSLQIMINKICGKDCLTLSHIMSLKANLYCCTNEDELIMRLHCGAIVPDAKFQVLPIAPLPIIPTALARNLAGPLRLSDVEGTPKMGYVTMDQTRKLLLLLESDPKVYNLPLIGIWISGVYSVHHPYVWASCLRYLNCSEIKDRVLHPSGSFLLLHYSIVQKLPDFWECSLENKETLNFELLSCQEDLHLDLGRLTSIVRVVCLVKEVLEKFAKATLSRERRKHRYAQECNTKEPLCFDLAQATDGTNKTLFDEAVTESKSEGKLFREMKKNAPHSTHNLQKGSPRVTNDENPRPSPSPQPSPTQFQGKLSFPPVPEESLSLSFDETPHKFNEDRPENTNENVKILAPRFTIPAKQQFAKLTSDDPERSFKPSRHPFKQIALENSEHAANIARERAKSRAPTRKQSGTKENKENTPLTSRPAEHLKQSRQSVARDIASPKTRKVFTNHSPIGYQDKRLLVVSENRNQNATPTRKTSKIGKNGNVELQKPDKVLINRSPSGHHEKRPLLSPNGNQSLPQFKQVQDGNIGLAVPDKAVKNCFSGGYHKESSLVPEIQKQTSVRPEQSSRLVKNVNIGLSEPDKVLTYLSPPGHLEKGQFIADGVNENSTQSKAMAYREPGKCDLSEDCFQQEKSLEADCFREKEHSNSSSLVFSNNESIGDSSTDSSTWEDCDDLSKTKEIGRKNKLDQVILSVDNCSDQTCKVVSRQQDVCHVEHLHVQDEPPSATKPGNFDTTIKQVNTDTAEKQQVAQGGTDDLTSGRVLQEQVKKQEDMIRVLQEQVRSLLRMKEEISSPGQNPCLPLTPACTPESNDGRSSRRQAEMREQNDSYSNMDARKEGAVKEYTTKEVQPTSVTIGVNTGTSLLWDNPAERKSNCCECNRNIQEGNGLALTIDDEHSNVTDRLLTPDRSESLASLSEVATPVDSTQSFPLTLNHVDIPNLSSDKNTGMACSQSTSTSHSEHSSQTNAVSVKGREFYDKLLFQVKDLLSEHVGTGHEGELSQQQSRATMNVVEQDSSSNPTVAVPTRELVENATLKELEKIKHSGHEGHQSHSRLQGEPSSIFSTYQRSMSTSFIPDHPRLNYVSMSVDDTFDEVTHIDEVALKYLSDKELKEFKSELRPTSGSVKRSFTRTVRFGSLPSDIEGKSPARELRSVREVDFTWNNLSFCTKKYLTKYKLAEGHIAFPTSDEDKSREPENVSDDQNDPQVDPCRPPFPSPVRRLSDDDNDEILDIARLKNLPKLF